jgi:hypothetical protein
MRNNIVISLNYYLAFLTFIFFIIFIIYKWQNHIANVVTLKV